MAAQPSRPQHSTEQRLASERIGEVRAPLATDDQPTILAVRDLPSSDRTRLLQRTSGRDHSILRPSRRMVEQRTSGGDDA